MRHIILLLMAVFGVAGSVFSQEISAEDKARAEKEIKSIVDKRVREIVTPLVLAEKLKMEFPPQAPTEKLENLKAKVTKDVMTQVDEKYPPSTRDIHLKAALEKYVLYKKGDTVKDLRIRAAGRKSVLSGEYKGLNRKGEHVVGGYPIPKVDATEEVMVHFDPALNKKKIETYIKNKMFYFHDDREKMKKDLTPKLEEKYCTEAGYYKSGESYVPADKFLKEFYGKEKERVALEIRKEIEEEILAKYNITETAVDAEIVADKGLGDSNSNSLEDLNKEEEPVEEKPAGVRGKIPLFDPSFYDPEF